MKVEKEKVDLLIRALKEEGGVEEIPPKGVTARFRFGKGVVQIYHTGSIVFGGKDREAVKEIVVRIVEERINSKKEFPVIGCDEAGKGEFFGPLVVACVWADEKAYRELLKMGIKDSKKLSDEKVIELADRIRKVCHGKIRVVSPKEYNRLYKRYKNLNRLMEDLYINALKDLLEKRGANQVIIDRFSNFIENRVKNAFPNVKVKAVVGGEEEPVVAAASIVAKAERLKRIRKMGEKYGIELKDGNKNGEKLLKVVPEEEKESCFKLHFRLKSAVLIKRP